MAVSDVLRQVEPFVSTVVPDPQNIDSSVDLFQKEIEAYLDRLRDALLEELEDIRDNCCP